MTANGLVGFRDPGSIKLRGLQCASLAPPVGGMLAADGALAFVMACARECAMSTFEAQASARQATPSGTPPRLDCSRATSLISA